MSLSLQLSQQSIYFMIGNDLRLMVLVTFSIIWIVGCNNTTIQNNQPGISTNWQRIGPGGGGSTFIPTFSYSAPSEFLVRCDMTGSYLTHDGGRSYHQVNFPNGASGYAFDPKDSNIIFIGSTFLNRSKDGGKTWEVVFPLKKEVLSEKWFGDHANYSIQTSKVSLYDTSSETISNIRVDPVSSATVYFSMGNYFFYTNDSCKTWQREDCGQSIDHIYTNSSNGKEVYIFTATSVFIFNKTSHSLMEKGFPAAMSPAFSFSGGATTGNGPVLFYALHQDQKEPIENEFGYSEVWMSDDLGATWKQIRDPEITNDDAGIPPSYSMIACAEFDARQVYLVCNRYEEKKDSSMIYWHGVLKTSDAGASWNWVWKGGGGSGQYGVKDGKDVSNLDDAWVAKAFGGEYIRLLDVGVYPYDGNIAVVTDWYRTMKTLDGGKTWQQIYSHEQPGGTYSTTGMNVTTTYGVHFDPFDSNHIAVSYTDIGYQQSLDGGKSWSRSVEGVPAEWVNTCYWIVFDPDMKGKLWSAWSGMHDLPRGKMTRNPQWKEKARGGVCVSDDGGKTWKPVNDGMGFDSPTTCIVLDPKSKRGHRTLYASVYNKGVFKSSDDGKTWTLKNNGIDNNTCAFELTLTSNGKLFVTVSPTPMHKEGKKGRAFYSGAVYRSVDGADSWTKLKVTKDLLFPNGIEYDRKNPERIYLACWSGIWLSDLIGGDIAKATGGNEALKMPGGIFLSEDGGDTWNSIFGEKQYVYDVTADPYHPGRLYCDTFNDAAYRSDDDGKTWKKIRGYDFHWGHRVIIDRNNHNKIYLTTYGSGVWHGSGEVE